MQTESIRGEHCARTGRPSSDRCLSPHQEGPTFGLGLVALLLLVCSLGLLYLLPVATCVKVGADEDFELTKPVLALSGYHMYTEVWDDQPPLYTFLIVQALKHISYSIAWPRMITVVFAAVLLGSVFVLLRGSFGVMAGALGALLVMASPGFVELSSSCMQEVPALAPVVVALCVLAGGRSRGSWFERVGSAGRNCGFEISDFKRASRQVANGQLEMANGKGQTAKGRWQMANGQVEMAPSYGEASEGRDGGVGGSKLWLAEMSAGVIFAVGLQIKYIGVVYLPLVLLIALARNRGSVSPVKGTLRSATVFGAGLLAGFVGINLITGSPLLLQLQQSWAAHFAGARSLEYGSPAEHPFEWWVLVKNWDLTVPAMVGVVFLGRGVWRAAGSGGKDWKNGKHAKHGRDAGDGTRAWRALLGAGRMQSADWAAVLLLGWVGLTLVVFPFHKPWWQYYYVHNAVPLSMCAAVGIVGVGREMAAKRREGRKEDGRRVRVWRVVFGIYLVCAAAWMSGRVYLQVSGIRNSPKIYSSLVLKEIERFKPLTKFMFTDQPVYSFHSRIPVPPNLAILSLKRFWTGDMTNERLAAELQEVRPGLMLLANSSNERPYQELLDREYRLVYQDGENSLYAHRSIAGKARY